MNSVRELHKQAMDLAQLSMIARQKGDIESAVKLARESLKFELLAADQIPPEESNEPTRSILYRSSASLAFQCKDYKLAKQLVAKGLSGFPIPQIEKELSDLYHQINFEEKNSIDLSYLGKNELNITLYGDAVSSGSIITDIFIEKVKNFTMLLDRITQRILGSPYLRSGRVPDIYKPFTPAVSALNSGSFQVTIKLYSNLGRQLELYATPETIVQESLIGIEMINESREETLKEKIPDEAYFNNFVSLARAIAPDGNKISLVGLSSAHKTVPFNRCRSEIALPVERETEEELEQKIIEIRGIIDYAVGRGKDIVGLTTEEGKPIKVSVQEGLDDLVKSYWRQEVVVNGRYDGATLYLTDIQPV